MLYSSITQVGVGTESRKRRESAWRSFIREIREKAILVLRLDLASMPSKIHASLCPRADFSPGLIVLENILQHWLDCRRFLPGLCLMPGSSCFRQVLCCSCYIAAGLNHLVWDLLRVITCLARRLFSYRSPCAPDVCPRSAARVSCCPVTTSQGFLTEHSCFAFSIKHSRALMRST